MTEDLSPAERYAAARIRAAEQATALAPFREMYDFGLDPFQIEACQALEAGQGRAGRRPHRLRQDHRRRVRRPPRPGQQGTKCFYTTPIKALSNQKYADLCKRYGADKVGLLTGDNSVNSDAPVVVMTTEVLRNMLYAGSQSLLGLGYVVMDEVHYLSDRFRGAVWEEVIIHLPESVTLVSLSATVSNAEEFGDWLDTVRGDTEVIVSEHRPVPLWQHVLAGRRMYDLFEEETDHGAAAPPAARSTPTWSGWPGWRTSGTVQPARPPARQDGPRGRPGARAPPARPDLDPGTARGHRPAGRRGAAARHHLHLQPRRLRGRRPAVPVRGAAAQRRGGARSRVREIVEERTASIPDEDLHVLGYYEWLEGLERGIAAHHAGMLPTFKEVVEELFVRGLVKAVFATETLALGINMPARSVVLEKLVKWNGEQHADITPGEYTQLTGRAGRRGIDVEGHAVVLWQRGMDPGALAGTGRHAHVSAALQLQAVVQHGGQPGRSSSAGTARASCWRRRSRSSRRTGRSSASPARCSATRRGWRATGRA